MLVGSGLLARAFRSYAESSDIAVFASGVSNSAENKSSEFDRERILLDNIISKQFPLIVYFGTCSIYDSSMKNSPYINHKIEMEDLIKTNSRGHLIFRLPQVVGETQNPHTLTNFFRDRLLNGEKFMIWANASRTIIDVDDVKTLCDHFVTQTSVRNRAINLYPPTSTTALELARLMERVLDLKGEYAVADLGSTPDVDSTEVIQASMACGIRFTPDYPERVLRKYYARA